MRVLPDTVLQWGGLPQGQCDHAARALPQSPIAFNDDIRGTAAVAVAGVFGALRISGGNVRPAHSARWNRRVRAGIASLWCRRCAQRDCRSRKRGCGSLRSTARGWSPRPPQHGNLQGGVRPGRREVAGFDCTDPAHVTLEEAIRNPKPTVLIGTSGTAGLFTSCRPRDDRRERPADHLSVVESDEQGGVRPPTQLAWSEGAPFSRRASSHRWRATAGGCASDRTTTFIFRAVGLGLWVGGVRRVTDAMFRCGACARKPRRPPTILRKVRSTRS